MKEPSMAIPFPKPHNPRPLSPIVLILKIQAIQLHTSYSNPLSISLRDRCINKAVNLLDQMANMALITHQPRVLALTQTVSDLLNFLNNIPIMIIRSPIDYLSWASFSPTQQASYLKESFRSRTTSLNFRPKVSRIITSWSKLACRTTFVDKNETLANQPSEEKNLSILSLTSLSASRLLVHVTFIRFNFQNP